MLKSIQFYFNLLLLGLSIFLIVESIKIPVKGDYLSSPQILPLTLSIVMLILMLITLLKDIKTKKNNQVLPENMTHFFGFIIITLSYVFLIPIIKFSFATFAFLLTTFLFLKATKLWKAILISIVFVIFIIVVFENIFQIIFP